MDILQGVWSSERNSNILKGEEVSRTVAFWAITIFQQGDRSFGPMNLPSLNLSLGARRLLPQLLYWKVHFFLGGGWFNTHPFFTLTVTNDPAPFLEQTVFGAEEPA